MLERCPLKLDCSNMTHDSHAVIYGILLTSLWGTTASHLAFTHRISLLVHWKVLMSCTKSIPTLGTAPFTSERPEGGVCLHFIEETNREEDFQRVWRI